MSLNGVAGTSIASGTPWGRHRPEGRSLLIVSCRCLYNAAAAGWNGTSTPFQAIFSRYRASGFLQIPVRSGLPSDVLGTGAERLGLPSAVRGILGSGTLAHCRKKRLMIVR